MRAGEGGGAWVRGGEGGPGADIDPVSVVRESWGGGPESGVGPGILP